MIYVHIKNKLKSFEADIRDLCLAFFSYSKIKYLYDDEIKNVTFEKDDIVVKDFYDKGLVGDRLKVKSELKRCLYDYLCGITKKKLLWGTLTGIRPVTIVTNYIENNERNGINVTRQDIKKYLKDEYYVSDKKINELIEIVDKELSLLKRWDIKDYKDRYSIYVGVPFCKSTCLYCSFTSFNIDKYKDYVDKYFDALKREFENRGRGQKYKPMTLYIGGGTPTSFSDNDFERLLEIIDSYVDKDGLIEYTVEAGRPDTITEKKLIAMKNHKVSRISINPQTFNQKTLDLIGRKHKVSDVIEKYRLARSIGFDNINMDLILGLPNEHIFEVINTLRNVLMLKPDSLTIHSLALKRAARLNYEFNDWSKNYYLSGIKNVKEMDKMFDMSKVVANLIKCEPYYLYRQKNMAGNLENVGYAKVGKECIYNIMMMSERHTVYGFGTATTKEVFYKKNNDNTINKRIESIEGYKSVIDYCNM